MVSDSKDVRRATSADFKLKEDAKPWDRPTVVLPTRLQLGGEARDERQDEGGSASVTEPDPRREARWWRSGRDRPCRDARRRQIRVESVDVHVDRGAFMECYARIMMRFKQR